MNACERYYNAINELVDGTLGPLRRSELELHLEGCDGCRALAADLQAIARSAAALPPLDPPAGVWAAIAGRLQAEGRVQPPPARATRRGSYTVLALAAALLLAIGSSLVLLVPRGDAPVSATGAAPAAAIAGGAENAPAEDPVQGAVSELTLTERHFERAVEQVTAGNAAVGPETKALLQKNLLVVNQALAESRKALEEDPDNVAARQSLYETLRQKIRFLQDTIALMNEMRQGDAAGAAEIVDGGKS